MNAVSTAKVSELLKELNLKDAAEAWTSISLRPEGTAEMTPGDVIEVLLTAEKNGRDRRRQEILKRQSRIPFPASINNITYGDSRDIEFQKTILLLSSLAFVKDGVNLTIYGGTGSGKTYIAAAMLAECSKRGMSGRFYNATDLLEYLASSKGSRYYQTKRAMLRRLSMLVIDDFSLTNYSVEEQEMLYDIMNDRYGKKTVVVTSQKAPDKWIEDMGKTTLAEAIVERMATNNYTLLLKGGSMRKQLQVPE